MLNSFLTGTTEDKKYETSVSVIAQLWTNIGPLFCYWNKLLLSIRKN